MTTTIEDILSDHVVTPEEVAAIVAKYDENGDGQLQGEEVRAFAKEVAAFLGNNLEDVLALLSFYQLDDDPALDPQEVRGFLELYLS